MTEDYEVRFKKMLGEADEHGLLQFLAKIKHANVAKNLPKDEVLKMPVDFLSHWAPKEPAKHRFMAGNTDHWAKMKHKVATFSIRDTTGKVRTFHGDRMRHEHFADKKSEEKLLKFRHEIDGTLTRIGGPNFSDILVKELHGNLPGDYHKPRPLPPKLLRTAVNARAKEGYIYWYMEKPPPKKGKTTFGSDKTFLGLGKRFFP